MTEPQQEQELELEPSEPPIHLHSTSGAQNAHCDKPYLLQIPGSMTKYAYPCPLKRSHHKCQAFVPYMPTLSTDANTAHAAPHERTRAKTRTHTQRQREATTTAATTPVATAAATATAKAATAVTTVTTTATATATAPATAAATTKTTTTTTT